MTGGCRAGIWLLLLTLATLCASAASPKRVLMVFREPSYEPANVMIEQAAQDKLRGHAGEGIEIYTEHLYAGSSRDYLREKYRDRRPDVILTTVMVVSELASGDLIPGVPEVFMWVNPDPFPGEPLGTNITGVVAVVDFRGTLDLIHRLQPDTRRIVVIGGVAPSDRRRLAQVEQTSQSVSNRATFEFWTNRPMSELQAAVSRLSTGSVVLYAWMFRDISGRTFYPAQALELLLERASVPVYVFVDSQLGSGAVGGAVVRYDELGARAAEVAQRILQGANAADIPITAMTNATPKFDWRALRRWGISESRLPPGSMVGYRERTFWELYRWPIAGTVLFCLLQAALIIGLLVNRAQRRQREVEAALIADISSRFVNLPADEVDREIEAALCRVCEPLGIDLALLWQWSDVTPGVVLPTHAYCAQENLRPSGPMRQDQYPWAVQQVLAGRTFAISSLKDYPAEATVDRETCRHFGIKAGVCIPLSVGGKPPIGALGLNVLRAEREWPEVLVKRLQLVAQIFANALARKRADQALRESEQKYRELHQSMRDAFATVDLTGRILDFNAAFQELLGYSAEELRRLTYLDLTPKRWQEIEAGIVREQVLTRGYSDVYEKEYRRKDGTEFPVELRTFLIRDQSGGPIAMWAIVRDLTERKQAQEAMAGLQRQNELILNSAAEGILGLDLQGNHVFINPAAARMLGYEARELLGRHSHSLWHHTRADGTPYPEEECKIYGSFADGTAHRESTEVFWRKDGTSFPVEYASTPIYENGRLLGAVVTFEDITARKHAEDRVRQLFLAVEQSPVSVVITDLEGKIIYVNRKFSEVSGYSLVECTGQTPRILKSGESPASTYQELWACITGGHIWRGEFHNRKKNGELYWEWAVISPLLDATGKVTHFVGVKEDITERKRAEAELLRQRAELAHLSRVTMLGELSGSMAHELNQPLTAILSNAQAAQRFLADDHPDLSELRDILGDIVAQDKRAGEVIRRLRLLLKKGEVQRHPLSVNEVVQEVLRLVRSDLVNQNFTAHTDLAPDLPLVHGDSVQLQQVLLNLVMNACEAMAGAEKDARRLTIRTKQSEDGSVQVSVIDCGPGIAPGKLEQVFESFYTTKAKGMGLGLAVCRSIITAHNGKMWATNNPSRGAAFHFTLPAIGQERGAGDEGRGPVRGSGGAL
jgi:PAS domain S-box-containing protein